MAESRILQAVDRLPDWQERLSALLDEAIAKPFAWGSHDCCTFAASAVQAVAGIDPLSEIRDTWNSERGAMRRAMRRGGLIRAAVGVLGEPLWKLQCRRGDLVLLHGTMTIGAFQAAIGVSFGSRVGVPGDSGLDFVPLASARGCWRIGRD